jgi:hypothetical protein
VWVCWQQGTVGLAKGDHRKFFKNSKTLKKTLKIVQTFWKLSKTFPVIKTIIFDRCFKHVLKNFGQMNAKGGPQGTLGLAKGGPQEIFQEFKNIQNLLNDRGRNRLRVLATVKNSALNAVFPITLRSQFPNLGQPKNSYRNSMLLIRH